MERLGAQRNLAGQNVVALNDAVAELKGEVSYHIQSKKTKNTIIFIDLHTLILTLYSFLF